MSSRCLRPPAAHTPISSYGTPARPMAHRTHTLDSTSPRAAPQCYRYTPSHYYYCRSSLHAPARTLDCICLWLGVPLRHPARTTRMLIRPTHVVTTYNALIHCIHCIGPFMCPCAREMRLFVCRCARCSGQMLMGRRAAFLLFVRRWLDASS